MVMNASSFETEIRKFTDQSFGSFVAFPTDALDAALKWSAAVTALMTTVVPASTGQVAAEAAMVTALGSLLPVNAPGAFDVGMAAYGVAIGAAQAGFVPPAIPNPAAWNLSGGTFASLIAAGLGGASAQAQAALFATNTVAYFVGWSSTPSAGPPVVFWS